MQGQAEHHSGYAYVCSIIANCISAPNPVAVAMGADGGTEINFGVMPVPFVPQPDDNGYIVGRAWIDSNGDGIPDPSEMPLNSYTVRLLDASGNQIATTATGASWGFGSYAFRISEPGLYRVQMSAAGGIYPASREVEVYVADRRVVNAHLPFAAGGTIGGQISDGNGRTDVQDIMQVAARWNNPAAYDPTYDVAPPFGSPIDILDIIAITGQWDTVCQ